MNNKFLLNQSGMSPDGTSRKGRYCLDPILSRFSLVSLICLCMLTIGSGNVWADSYVSISSGSFATSGTIGSIFPYTIVQNSGTNAPYTTNGNLRMYWQSNGNGQGNNFTITVPSSYTITGVTIEASSGYTPTVKYNVDGGSDVTGSWSSTTMTISGISATSSFAFRNANTANNTQLRPTNVTIYYTYAATKHTVRFYTASGTYTDLEEESAEAGVIPPTMSTPCDGWAFQGWSKSQSNSTTSTTVLSIETLTAGKYYPTADVTLYPVYTKSGGTAFSSYTLLSLGSTVTDGKYLISTGTYTMAGSGKTGASFTPGTTESTAKEYTITTLGSGVFTIKGPDNKYIGGNDNTTLQFSTSTPSTNAYKWKYNSTGIQNQGTTSRYIRAYQTTDFRHYTTSNGTQTKLYKRTEASVTYYYSYPTCCTELGSINGSFWWTYHFLPLSPCKYSPELH